MECGEAFRFLPGFDGYEAARHGRRARNEGTGKSLRDGPRSEGSLAAGQTRMPGWPSLWLLLLARQEKVTRRARRNLSVGAKESVARIQAGRLRK